MNLFRQKTPSGKLSPTWSVRYRVDGKQIKRSTGCTTRRDAEAWVKENVRETVAAAKGANSAVKLVERHQQLQAKADPVALVEAWSLFMTTPRGMVASEKQQAGNASRWADFCAFMADADPTATTLAQVTECHAKDYIARLQTSGRVTGATYTRKGKGRRKAKTVVVPARDRKLSARSLNAYRDTCAMIFGELGARAGCVGNPFASVPSAARGDYARREAFSLVEVGALVRHADDFMQPLLVIIANTGLRLGDACNLRWRNVAGEWITITMSKTGREVAIPIFDKRLVPWLENRRGRADAFILPDQQAMHEGNPDGLSQRFKALVAHVAEVEGWELVATEPVKGRTRAASRRDWHSLRHSFLTLAAGHGVAPHILQRLAGHSSLSMTGRYVDHDDKKLTAAQLSGLNILPPEWFGTMQPKALPGGECGPLDAGEALAAIRAALATNGAPEAALATIRGIITKVRT